MKKKMGTYIRYIHHFVTVGIFFQTLLLNYPTFATTAK